MPAASFDPEFRAGLIALADAAERNLGLSGAHLAMVCHSRRDAPGGPVYEVSLASDKTPELIREMRRGFPRRGKGGQSFSINPLGALFLVDVTLADLDAARAAITPA